MIKHISTTLFLFFSLVSYSQRSIELHHEKININNIKFYVSKVVDKRENKGSIGKFKTDSTIENITISGSVLKGFGDYFQRNLTKKSNEQIPVIINIIYVKVSDTIQNDKLIGEAKLTLEFIKENGENKTINSTITEITNDIFASHEKRIRQALSDCINKYNETLKLDEYEIVSDEDAI